MGQRRPLRHDLKKAALFALSRKHFLDGPQPLHNFIRLLHMGLLRRIDAQQVHHGECRHKEKWDKEHPRIIMFALKVSNGLGARKPGGKLYMRRPAELIDNLHPIQGVAGVNQQTRIPCERHRITTDRGDNRYSGSAEFDDLRLGPGAWRINDNGIGFRQLIG